MSATGVYDDRVIAWVDRLRRGRERGTHPAATRIRFVRHSSD